MSRKGKYVPDKILLACVLVLALFGLLMQYSASSYSALTRTVSGIRKYPCFFCYLRRIRYNIYHKIYCSPRFFL